MSSAVRPRAVAWQSAMGSDVTQILAAIESGDAHAADALLPLVYEELRKLAAQRLANEAGGQTLQATALVHEAYLRLVGDQDPSATNWNSRGHFFAAAAEAMRRILIDRARAKRSKKRGGSRNKLAIDALALDSLTMSVDSIPDEIIDLSDALTKLAAEDRIGSDLVKLCFFGGLSLKDAARILNIPATTASRYWTYARAWLYSELTADGDARDG